MCGDLLVPKEVIVVCGVRGLPSGEGFMMLFLWVIMLFLLLLLLLLVVVVLRLFMVTLWCVENSWVCV